MWIVVLGAGGVGSYYGGLLAHAGHRVSMLARGKHLFALSAGGIEVRTPDGGFTARVEAGEDVSRFLGADLAIVSVKTYSLDEIAPVARKLSERCGTLLPLLNGIDAADRLIAAGVPADCVLGGLTEIGATRVAPGVVERRTPFQRIVVGELSGPPAERTEKVAAVLSSAGIETRVSEEIRADLWRKLAFISSLAAACGLARAAVGAIRKAPLGPLLFERAVREAVAVASAQGIPLGESDVERTMRFFESLPDHTKPSFLVDIEAGRRTELEDLSGAISRLGRAGGVPTPVHDTALAALSLVAAGSGR